MSAEHNDPIHTQPPGENGDESHVEPDEIGVGMLTVIGAMVGVVIVLIVVLLQAWFYDWKDAVAAERSAPVEGQAAPAAIAQRQLARLETYGWADATKRDARVIPIERAMSLVVKEYNGKRIEAAGDSEKK